ncbi:biotin--[acetyl-CoA-carboxylase] ligase [Thermostaphylospora chromogena]|uniref:biotin--[biotin carboxyl-carrier protein] ligase n=1 Tax=Thermostaphylospora chromogena TaxID=35622 RepID=A0A1H1EGS9_9ACTN|nr:biotin--[acetyl-CoA-carboxylase] ligase [Thermostaphylospora chromogena]SDQ87669.1 BirA family transcriptional regulator, biotin operon repressor / biotin-[acetyl-CoA-carboxylase] ligase [Thermostaphylospora chromogena]
MTDSPYTDLDRPPLSQSALNRALLRPGGLWTRITVVDSTGSTNADLARAAREGAPEGSVLVAEVQTAGKGRLGRSWTAPPRSALTFSFLLRPRVPVARHGWLPLLAGLGVVSGVRRVGEVEARLKWPNDVLIGERKLAGVLAERVDDAVIVGIGLNVGLRAEELPVATATSLAVAGAASTDREPLLKAVLRAIEAGYREWTAAGGDADACGLRPAYLAASATVGGRVRVELPGEQTLLGRATGVDESGRLLVEPDDPDEGGERAVSAGDVVHVRPRL